MLCCGSHTGRLASLQVSMDSTGSQQGMIAEDVGIDSSLNSPYGEMLTCSRPLMEKRLRTQHDEALKCPRCDSANTKFCYYNNYSLSQPRYFCKTCRRYWTKGGSLRSIPVGGRCRKKKKPSSSSKKSSPSSSSSTTDHQPSIANDQSLLGISLPLNPMDLQFSFPFKVHQLDFPNFVGASRSFSSTNDFLENKYETISRLEKSPRPIDFLESKFECTMGNIMSGARNHDFLTNGNEFGIVDGVRDWSNHGQVSNISGICSLFDVSFDHGNNSSAFDENSQDMMQPYDGINGKEQSVAKDVKPHTKFLSLEWQDQDACLEYPFGNDPIR